MTTIVTRPEDQSPETVYQWMSKSLCHRGIQPQEAAAILGKLVSEDKGLTGDWEKPARDVPGRFKEGIWKKVAAQALEWIGANCATHPAKAEFLPDPPHHAHGKSKTKDPAVINPPSG